MAVYAEFTLTFLADLNARAKVSPRGRQHHNIHIDHTEPVQRLFNAIGVDSYIRPHRHRLDPRQELLIAVRGRFALLLFDDTGNIARHLPFGTSCDVGAGAEVHPSQWHTVVALEEDSILLEIKPGPFDPAATKEWAVWSPEEGSPASIDYLRLLKSYVTARPRHNAV